MGSQRKILQWNMGCGALAVVTTNAMNSRLQVIESLVSQHAPSIVAIQESPYETSAILRKAGFTVYASGELVLGMRNVDWSKGQVFVRQKKLLCVGVPVTSLHVLLVSNVHLLSRQRSEQLQREDAAREVLSPILAMRMRKGMVKCSEIIIGDFNLNPHDAVMMQRTGFFANRSTTFVKKTAKKTVAPKRPMYNPAWHIYGRAEEPLGSLYDTGPMDGPWLVFDQVLMSADLIGSNSHEVIVVTGADGTGLLSSGVKRPDKEKGSDHLPLISTFTV